MNNIGNDNNIGEDNNDDDMFLQLGDIIQLIAPSNPDINEKTFLIYYLDTEKLRLINTSTGVKSMLLLNQDGSFKDESITNVTIILREKEQGFARQNGLIPGVWLDIYFGGDLPQTITGQITDLEEDMIEIKVYPENTMMYIDFEYKGIPEQLPITKMVIRDSPMDVKKDDLDTLSDEEQLRKKDEPKKEPDYIGYWADMMDEEDDDKEKLDEWANDAGKRGTETAFTMDEDYMLNTISSGLNKRKSTGQTTTPVIPGQKERMGGDGLNEWKRLAGITR